MESPLRRPPPCLKRVQAAYRIPSMITTENGTVLAVADGRRSSIADSPNNIDTVIRRSTDNGETWSDIKTIIDYPGSGKDGASTIDASLLQDRETGTIWLLIDHFPGGVGFQNAEQGTGFDTQGYRLLYDKEGHTYTLGENGHVYDENQEKTDYHASENGDVTLQDTKQGNIYLKAGAGSDQNLYEDRTAFVQILKSEDDGKTCKTPN